MKTSSGQGLFKVNAVTAGCLVALIATGVQAQQQQLDTIVVTGIRKGIEDAISVKKNKDSIVESISAEDIGKLPDISIAESIARLPGLAAQRVNGQAQQISIRGTAPDLSSALLNGREQVSTSGDRYVEYDQYPAELISGVTVYKTGDAALMGQGLAGTVNLQTVQPLNFKKREIAVNLRGERNGNGAISAGAEKSGNRVSASYIDQFANRTLGMALGFAHSDRPVARYQFETWNWVKPGGMSGAGITDANALYPQGIKGLNYTGNEKRDGLMAVLQWRPSSDYQSTFDVYHSKFSFDETRRGMEIPFENWSGANFSSTTITNGQALKGTLLATPVVRNNLLTRDDKLTAMGWNHQLKAGDWKLGLDLSRSTADHDEYLIELNSGLGPDTISYDYTGPVPKLTFGKNYADASAIQLGGPFGQGYVNVPSFRDELRSLRLEASTDLNVGLVSSLDLGLNFSQREKSRQHLETGFGVKSPSFASGVLLPSTDLSRVGLPAILAWDVPAVIATNLNAFTPAVLNPWGATKNWAIEEDVATAFVKVGLDGELFGLPMRGNLGLQLVHTDQSSTSNALLQWPLASLVEVEDGKKYTDVLPTVNLAFTLVDQQQLRVGFGRSLARPKLDQLNASFQVGLSAGTTGVPNGSGGNPQLDPWKADYLDVSWEKYFGNKGYVAVAGFYKNLKSYIYEVNTPFDFKDYPLTGTAPDGTPIAPSTTLGTVTRPENGKGGRLSGLEFSLSVPMDLLAESLRGFGVVANFSLTDSAITVKDQRFGNQDLPLPGLSKRVLNLTAYYERDGFSARVSRRHRSDFLGSIGGPGGTSERTFIKADTVVDLQLGYEFQTGAAKGLSLLWQVNNLTDTAFQTYSGEGNRYRGWEKYGRQTLLGANYKL
ncbi:TonB-dependent receptor [Pseudorhodoferax sp.]|uniref:TonB-dependent receptor n=1 Tax=Pseudorhodoferax sp. TaxID=1993553 RepID=UPI002DD6B62D|nr:TonB-dependent receptor [Pseudorhodoferax sp.]